jgi:hypothetical protein
MPAVVIKPWAPQRLFGAHPRIAESRAMEFAIRYMPNTWSSQEAAYLPETS